MKAFFSFLIGALIGAGVILGLDFTNLWRLPRQVATVITVPLDKEQSQLVLDAIEAFDGKEIELSDKPGCWIQCPGKSPEGCNLKFRTM